MRSHMGRLCIGGLALALAGFAPVSAEDADDFERLSDRKTVQRVADRHDLSQADAQELIADPTTRVTPQGDVYYVEPAPDPKQQSRQGASAESRAEASSSDDVFALHSDPEAPVTIYLDFTGGVMSGTRWNGYRGVPDSYEVEAWSPATHSELTDKQKLIIEDTWLTVAEDFAPFRVDVTTEDPGPAALARTSVNDSAYGSHVLITPEWRLREAVCGPCAGVAFLGDFDAIEAVRTPALVFRTAYTTGRQVGDVVSHEVGHNLNLTHDGVVDADGKRFDTHWGGLVWSPLMGAGMGPLSQWSNGDYPGATNQQDDLAVIAQNGAIARRDEAPATPPGAPLSEEMSYINLGGDVDVFALPACDEVQTVWAQESSKLSNLDLTLEILDTAGQVIAHDDNPASLYGSPSAFRGLSGVVSFPAAGDEYSVRIRGGADLSDPPEGYSAYGSVGGYTLETACGPETLAEAPSGMRAEVKRSGPLVHWDPPPASGPVVTGYRVTHAGRSLDIPADSRSHQFGVARESDYTVAVAAVTEAGAGPAARLTGRTVDQTRFNVDTEIDAPAGTITLRWSQVTTDPRAPFTGWRIEQNRDFFDFPKDTRSYTISGVTPGNRFMVTLCPSYWTAERSLVRREARRFATECWSEFLRLAQPSSPPLNLALSPVLNGSASLTWQAPESPGDGGYVYYEWSIDGGRWQEGDQGSAELSGLAPGETYDLAVRARTEAGYSRPATARLTATGPSAPSAPTDVRVRRGNKKAFVTWTAPESQAPITKYRLTTRPWTRRWTVPGDLTSAPLRPLRNGREVTVTVRAISDFGVSAKSAPSNTVVPATAPGRVWKTRVRQTKRKLIFTWQRPRTNGAPILRYRVRFDGTRRTATTERLVVRKPSPGKYHLQVLAINDVGRNRYSKPFVVRVKGKRR